MVRVHFPWTLAISALALFGATDPLAAAERAKINEVRTQRVGETVYFFLRLETPADCRTPAIVQWKGSELQRRLLCRLPRLVPQDGRSSAVYARVSIPSYLPKVGFEPTDKPMPIRGLEFVGKLGGGDTGRFLLLYPTSDAVPLVPRIADGNKSENLEPGWAEVPIEVDFHQTASVAAPMRSVSRKAAVPPDANDLEGLWAEAQAAQFAILEALTPDFGFYGFACAATGRKYSVDAPMLQPEEAKNREKLHRELYETTTGSAAITQSLQLHRMLTSNYRDSGRRSVNIADVPGITIAEHPWLKMIGTKMPTPEPLARFAPKDNFYAHFKSIRKFIEFGELLDQWGTNFTRAYEINSRDYAIKQRYEKQLCLRSTWQGKTFGPAIVHGLAITGSDGYLREGTDLTLIFDVTDPKAFLAGVQPFLDEARKEFGKDLRESRIQYYQTWLESYVTPRREVSLHRAVVDHFVVYSNSLVALKRSLGSYMGKLPCLEESLDFRYMRTVFRLEDEREDGFLFLSDAFIRQLVGPASKIKEKRRLEALTTLGMATNGALFTAWETGKLPKDHPALLAGSSLKPTELVGPEGDAVTWDPAQGVAYSDTYNTLHFPTPLIELPIDKITSAEAAEYGDFRRQYLELWRQYFDPVGVRFALSDKQVQLETYILPLVQLEQYRELRQFAGGGTAKFDLARLSPNSLFQITAHINPEMRDQCNAFLTNMRAPVRVDDQAMIRIDDGPHFTQLAEWWLQNDFTAEYPKFENAFLEREWSKFRITLGIGFKSEKPDGAIKLLTWLEKQSPFRIEHEKRPPYKETPISRSLPAWEVIPSLFHTAVDNTWYVATSEDSIKEIIDRSVTRRELGKTKPTKPNTVDINASIYLSPAAAKKAGPALRYYLEWETQRRVRGNLPIWYALFQSGLVSDHMPIKARDALARQFFGFVPVSPDDTAYEFDFKKGEIVNARHGSMRQPRWHGGIDADSPLAKLLDQFPTLWADLRFQEDGINTTVTIERKAGKR